MKTRRSYGDGAIDERGPGVYRLRYRLGGKRFAKTFHGPISEARKELRRLIRSGDVGEHIEPDKITLALWIDRWIALLERQPEEGGERRRALVNRRTLERYEELLRCHVAPTLGLRQLQQIKPTEIDDLYMKLEKKLAVRTVHHIHTLMGTVLDEVQLRALVDGCRSSVLFPIVAVAAFTGARRNEILGLRWSDLDVESKSLRIERALEETDKFGLALKEPKTARKQAFDHDR
jgi:integrase